MKRTTIKDIAQQLGINPSTVSRALKDHPDIGATLRAEIKKLAAQMHYRPNQMAVYLRQQSSRLIGLIVPEVTMFFYPSVMKGIQEVLHDAGYNLIMLPSNESLEREIDNIRICSENDVAGIMLSFSRYRQTSEQLSALEEIGAPVVMFDKIIEELPYDAVVLEDFQSAYTAVHHLISTGCSRIGGLFGNPDLRITQLRLDGFRQAIADAGLPCKEEYIRFSDSSYAAEQDAAYLMNLRVPPDGVFAMTDEIIIGSLPSFVRSGKKIPEECSIICISDGFLPYCLYPKVTFLHHDGYEVGRMTAQRMLKLIEEERYPDHNRKGEVIMFSPPLMELDTTRKRNL